MTNGEMIQKIFNCEVCEPIIEEDIIHVIFPDKNDSAIGFDWSWWNAEYKEPTAKNDLGVDCISRADVLKLMQDNWHNHNGDWAMQESMDDIRALPSVTLQEPRKGKWIDTNDKGFEYHRIYKCSNCEYTVCAYPEEIKRYKFCYGCGSRNEVEK